MATSSGLESDASELRNWDDLRFFLAVGRWSTLAQASKTLSVEVSTVHRRLAALEGDWGVELFERTPSGHELTAQGKHLFEMATQVESAVSALQRELSETDKRRVIRLTTTDDFIEFLSPSVSRFCAASHDVQVRLLAAERVLNLVQREADIAVRFSQTNHKELVVKPLCTLAFALYASESYIQTHGSPAHEADLAVHGFIAAEGALGNLPIMRWLLDRVAPARVWSVCNTVSTIAAATAGGIGIGPLPCFVGDRHPGLVRVFGPVLGTDVESSLAYHVSLRKSERAQAFVKYLKQVFADNAALFAGNV